MFARFLDGFDVTIASCSGNCSIPEPASIWLTGTALLCVLAGQVAKRSAPQLKLTHVTPIAGDGIIKCLSCGACNTPERTVNRALQGRFRRADGGARILRGLPERSFPEQTSTVPAPRQGQLASGIRHRDYLGKFH